MRLKPMPSKNLSMIELTAKLQKAEEDNQELKQTIADLSAVNLQLQQKLQSERHDSEARIQEIMLKNIVLEKQLKDMATDKQVLGQQP